MEVGTELRAEVETGPWEGQNACDVCSHIISWEEYRTNYHGKYHPVCPYCGVPNVSIGGVVRRKVFFEPARKHPWWRRLLGLPERERSFEWEEKERAVEEGAQDDTVTFTCWQCDELRPHRFDVDERNGVCETCGAVSTLHAEEVDGSTD